MHAFEQYPTDSLNDTSDHLAFNKHRVHRNTAVMSYYISLDLYFSRMYINVNYGSMHCIGPSHCRWLIVVSTLEPWLQAFWPAMVPTWACCLCYLGER